MSYIESIIVEEMGKSERGLFDGPSGVICWGITDEQYNSVAQAIVSRIKERVEGLDRYRWDSYNMETSKDGYWDKHSDILALFNKEGGSDEN